MEGVNRLGLLMGGRWRRDSRDADQYHAKPEAAE
jgi:hypothetical protein